MISPYKLDLSQFGDKVRSEIEFQINNVSDQPLVVSLIDKASHYFKVDLPNKIAAGESIKAKVTLIDKGLTDAFDKSLTFELDDQEKSRFTVPVKRTLHPSPGASTTGHSQAP